MADQSPATLTAVIVDDESLARAFLKEMLRAHPEIEIAAECADGFSAVRTIVELRPDVVFLDIAMPKLTGFEVLEALEPELPRIIFVTAYDEYALRAFEVHAVDYLLKPFSKERLADAISRLFSNSAPSLPSARQMSLEASPDASGPKRFVIRDGGKVTVLRASEIRYIAAEGDYISIHTKTDTHLKLETISSAERALANSTFVRIHRSTLLNLDHLDRVDTSDTDAKAAVLRDGGRLAISRTGYKALMEALKNSDTASR